MRAAIYCRLSEEDREKLHKTDDSASIHNQKIMLMQYASRHNWTVCDVYSDENYSGADRNRPGFNRLIADAGAGKFDIVLCKTQSRFTREMELVEKYLHGLFPKLGIRFVSIVDHADTEDKGNKKSRQINGLVNEWYLEDLSDNIKSILTSRRQNGLHIGSFAPYGYQKDPERKGHLEIDTEAAAVVQEIFTLFSQGYGKQGIARILNERGVPNPTEYKRLHGMIRNRNAQSGILWHSNTVSQILTNEVYIGNMVQGKTGVISYRIQKKRRIPQEQWMVVNGTHEPVIDRSLWDQVQGLISRKATGSSGGTVGVFAGKVRCLSCGGRMRSVKSGEKRGFKCETHAISPCACTGCSISLRKLERIVAAELHLLSVQRIEEETLVNGIDWSDTNQSQLIHQALDTRNLSREMVDFLIDHILVGKWDPLTKETPVEIHWNF